MSEKNLPEILGYRFERVLGTGGFGTSYLAYSEALNIPCVIKRLSFERLQDWKSLELFEREARTLAQLDHARIPKFIAYQTQTQTDGQDQLYLIQAYTPGRSLTECVEQGERFSEAQIVQIALDCAQILVYLQELNPPLIHRDIKPGNLILNDAGEAFLIDFGAVGNQHKSQQGSSTMVGTFGYMAPEQFQGRATATTDIYGLGATLLYALTHKAPHEFASKGLKLNFREDLNISVACADMLEKMLEPDWEQRYTPIMLVRDLKALQAGQLTSIQPPSVSLPKEATPALAKKILAGVLIVIGIGTLQNCLSHDARERAFQRQREVLEETYRAENDQLSPAQEQELKQKLDQIK